MAEVKFTPVFYWNLMIFKIFESLHYDKELDFDPKDIIGDYDDPNTLAPKPEDLRYSINQGGTRSSKTYSILQLIITYICPSYKGKGLRINVYRKTLKEARAHIWPDLMRILSDSGLIDLCKINKSDNTIELFGNTVKLVGISDPQKARGGECDIAYINEGNGLTVEDWTQIKMRLKGFCFIDYNPSHDFWIDDILKDELIKFAFVKSTYLNNPTLPPGQVREIEDLIKTSDRYYRIYALGERVPPEGMIYPHYKICSYGRFLELPRHTRVFGFDYGSAHPSALVELRYFENDLYFHESFYEANLSEEEIVQRFKDSGVILQEDIIYCDYAARGVLRRLKEEGFYAIEAKKEVREGLGLLRSNNLFFTKDSTSLLAEVEDYKYKLNPLNGKPIDGRPVKDKDDGMDACRYAAFSDKNRRTAY